MIDGSLNGPASAETLAAAEASLGISLPVDYKAFMLEHDGGEGFVGSHYLALWRSANLEQWNREYEVAVHAPHFIAFGSDGGGELFAFDTRKVPFDVVMVGAIGMSETNGIRVASGFTHLLERMRADDKSLLE